MALSPDGAILASSWGSPVTLYDVRSGRALSALQTRTTMTINGVAWSPDGTTLATVGDDAAVTFWDAGTHGSSGRCCRARGKRSASRSAQVATW